MFAMKEENKLIEINVSQIKPNQMQPRKIFKESELCSLAQSIANNGIIQPLTVKKIANNEYELIAGERRLRASIMAGINKVPCIVMKCTQRQSAVFALIENLQRSELNIFEEAVAIKRLIVECNLTQERVAKQLGKNQSTIANKLRLLRLEQDEQNLIILHNLSERHARIILKLDYNKRKEVLQKVITQKLNVVQTENLVKKMLKSEEINKKNKQSKLIVKDVRIFMNTLDKAVETMVLSGVDAKKEKKENELFIEYTIKIPKAKAYKQKEELNIIEKIEENNSNFPALVKAI